MFFGGFKKKKRVKVKPSQIMFQIYTKKKDHIIVKTWHFQIKLCAHTNAPDDDTHGSKLNHLHLTDQ